MNALKTFALAGLAVTVLGAAPALARGGWGHGPGGFAGGPGGFGCSERETPLTTNQVRDIIEGRIAWRGEDLKVGKVAEANPGTIVAEVVKPDGSLVRKVEVDAKTGHFRPAE